MRIEASVRPAFHPSFEAAWVWTPHEGHIHIRCDQAGCALEAPLGPAALDRLESMRRSVDLGALSSARWGLDGMTVALRLTDPATGLDHACTVWSPDRDDTPACWSVCDALFWAGVSAPLRSPGPYLLELMTLYADFGVPMRLDPAHQPPQLRLFGTLHAGHAPTLQARLERAFPPGARLQAELTNVHTLAPEVCAVLLALEARTEVVKWAASAAAIQALGRAGLPRNRMVCVDRTRLVTRLEGSIV